jgi:osmotically-inducible protein OsmY
MKIKRLLTSIVLTLLMATVLLAGDKPPDDNFLYDSVRERLAGDIVVKGGAIEVEVKNAVVTLNGHVQEAKQKSRAESLAKKVKGVKSVVNNLQVVPQ